MLLPLLFQYQELYNSCPPVLQSEIQIISLLGGTIEISMNLIPNNLQCVIGIDTDLFYTDCGKTAYCKTQQNKTNPQPGFHSSSMVSLWRGVPEQLMPTVSGVRRSLQKVKKCHFSMHVNSDVLQMMDSIPFFSARLVCAGHCHQSEPFFSLSW